MLSHRKVFAVVLVLWLGCSVQGGLAQSTSGLSHAALGIVTTVATFDPAPPQSQLPEGVAVDKEGNIYVGFYPTGQILKITPDGEQSIFATLDVSGTVGGGLVGFALDKEGDLYVCDASGEPATHGIWKVSRNGATRRIAALDPSGFPNDLVFDEGGDLFVTDSYLGEIWRISKSGETKVWLKDPLLAMVFAYGANGIAIDRGDLFVTNTDQSTIVRIELGDEDRPPHAEVFVQNPLLFGADGISFDVRHNAYVTSDYINLLVRVSADGDVQTLATASDGLDFPADTTFSQTQGQRTFLFWTNGGYNFALPSLQKLDVGVPGCVRCEL
jgi:sugar lactone lactonase YvrE